MLNLPARPFCPKGGPGRIETGDWRGFVPAILNTSVYDEIVTCKTRMRLQPLASLRKRRFLAGISSGAALWAAGELAKRSENAGKTIVVLLPDTGERYLSTALFADLA